MGILLAATGLWSPYHPTWLGLYGLIALFAVLGIVRLVIHPRDPSHDPD
jgi:hypothetical protein